MSVENENGWGFVVETGKSMGAALGSPMLSESPSSSS